MVALLVNSLPTQVRVDSSSSSSQLLVRTNQIQVGVVSCELVVNSFLLVISYFL